MRKFFSVAMESQPTNVNMISLEEEEVIMDEAVQDGTEVSQDLQEAERIIEVSDALEDLAVIADGIEEASPTEVALIENAGQMAVAGTDVEVDEIIPAVVADEMPAEDAVGEDGKPVPTPTMESYVGRKISTEGIREVARTIWENIKKFVKAIWEKITRFFHNVYVGIPRLSSNLASIKGEIDELVKSKATNSKAEVVMTAGAGTLSLNGAAFKDGADLLAGLTKLNKESSWVFGVYATSLAKRGEEMAKIIGGFDPKVPTKAVEEMCKLFKSPIATFTGTKDSKKFEGYETTVGEEVLGGATVMYKHFNGFVEGSGSEVDLERARKGGLVLDKKAADVKECKFQSFDLAVARKLIEECEDLVTKLSAYDRGAGYKNLQKAKTTLEAASAKASVTMAGFKTEEGGAEKKVVSYFRSSINFNTAFANWAYNPMGPLVMHDISVIKAIIVAVKKSLAAYAAVPAEEKK